MRVTLSKKDAPRLTASQLAQHTRVMRALRLVQQDPYQSSHGKRSIWRTFFGDHELRLEGYTDGSWGAGSKSGTVAYLDGERIGDRCPEHSASRCIARLLREDRPGHLPESITNLPVSNSRHWKRIPTPGQENVPQTGIVIKSDHVFVEGIRLKKFPRPGPLTPSAADVVIPKGVDRELRVVAAALAANRPILLSGDTGTGKTMLVRYLAFLCNANLLQVVGDPEYSPSLWLGHLHAKAGSTYWVDGDLPTAMKGIEGNGQTWLFVDELSRMLPDNTSPLLPVLERHGGRLGKLRLADQPELSKKMVSAHPDFRVVLAMNPFDADFVGTQEVDLALLRRILLQVVMDYPDLDASYRLLKEAHPKLPADELRRIAKVGEKLRNERRAKRIQFPAAPDVLETWAAFVPTLGFDEAARVTILNKATSEDRPMVEKIIRETR